MLLADDPPQQKRGPRFIPVAGSAAVHALYFAWLMAPPLPKAHPSAYDQLIRPREDHLVWYNFKRTLPEVQPQRQSPDKRPLKAEVKLEKQSIVSAPVNAPKEAQMIFHPVPELKVQPMQPLPNLIALAAPPPPRREFVPPPQQQVKRDLPKLAPISPAPEIAAKASSSDIYKLPEVYRPFAAPAERKQTLTAQVRSIEAPQINSSAAGLSANAERALDLGSRTLAFRPQTRPSKTASIGNMPDAPVLESAGMGQANVAVVGLNPIENLNVPLPSGSRKAQFSGGPKLNPNGATSSGVGSGITVPDLTVRGGERSAEPTLIARSVSPAYNSPTSPEALRELARENARKSPATEDLSARPATRVSGAPDPRFQGRQVFSMAIQAANLTSHSGSWLMWYADRGAIPFGSAISAPSPMHKVDPRYNPTAVEDRVEGTVRLAFVIGHDGHVYGVETVKGIDSRIDESAVEALRKWEFEPAMRDGKPIDVDALVDIPFRLAPRATK
jgi:TonB family protein